MTENLKVIDHLKFLVPLDFLSNQLKMLPKINYANPWSLMYQ